MPNHSEISVVTTLDTVADHALFASEIAYPRKRRYFRQPISVGEQTASVIAISQLMISLEGYINRVLYFLEQDDPPFSSVLVADNPHAKLAAILGNGSSARSTLTKFDEALVMRNSIMHSHIYQTDRNENRRILNVEQRILRSNRGYTTHVNTSTYRTKRTKFHVIPTEIGFDDVLKSLELWNKIYSIIESRHGHGVSYLAPYYPYNFRRFLKANGKDNEFEAIPLDNNGSFTNLIRYFKDVSLYKQIALSGQNA